MPKPADGQGLATVGKLYGGIGETLAVKSSSPEMDEGFAAVKFSGIIVFGASPPQPVSLQLTGSLVRDLSASGKTFDAGPAPAGTVEVFDVSIDGVPQETRYAPPEGMDGAFKTSFVCKGGKLGIGGVSSVPGSGGHFVPAR